MPGSGSNASCDRGGDKTSATDNNNNPNIINSIYNVAARLGTATEERMRGPAVDFPPGGEMRRVPHVLVDGADSIGMAAALAVDYLYKSRLSELFHGVLKAEVGNSLQQKTQTKIIKPLLRLNPFRAHVAMTAHVLLI